jgi:predicted nucleic acid-binding Zn ribbon protein
VSSPNDRRKAVPGAARSGEAQGLGSVLDGLLLGRAWRDGMVLGDLARRWAEVVGERLADESRPADLEGDVLTVRASSAAWATQIGFLAQEVVRRSNDVIGRPLVGSVRVLVEAREGPRTRSQRGDVGGSE